MIPISLITIGFCFYVLYRNSRVYEFRNQLLEAMYDSGYFLELEDEFNEVSYGLMVFSFKPLRVECWFSEDFCEKINQVE